MIKNKDRAADKGHETIQLNVELPASLVEIVKADAAFSGLTLQVWTEIALREALSKSQCPKDKVVSLAQNKAERKGFKLRQPYIEEYISASKAHRRDNARSKKTHGSVNLARAIEDVHQSQTEQLKHQPPGRKDRSPGS